MKTKKTEWTIEEIVEANDQAGGYFFSHGAMTSFGDTLDNFVVMNLEGRVFIQRVENSRNAPTGYNSVGEMREFNPETGSISGVKRLDQLPPPF